MKLLKLFLLSIMFVAGLSLTGCNEEPITSVTPGVPNPTVSKFTLESDWTFQSAFLYLRVDRNQNPRQVDIRPVNITWDCPNWDDFYPGGVLGTEFGPVFDTFTADTGFKAIEVTSLVNGWFTDPTTNHGVILMESAEYDVATQIWINSSDETTEWKRPYLLINYLDENNVAQQHKEYPLADTWISELDPEDYYCTSNLIRVLNFNDGVEDPYRKEGLIKFDLEMEPPVVMECETAYAFGGAAAQCIIELPNVNNWGWTNLITGPGTWDYPIYAGAGQCDITKGTLVGTLEVDYDGTTVTVEYVIDSDFILDETHLWIGTTQLPVKRGKFTSAPGQFNFNGQNPVEYDIAAPFYIAAHSVVCGEYE